MSKLAYRSIQPSDLGYIINTWMHTARHSNRHGYMTNDDYKDFYEPQIVQLLARKNTYVKIVYVEPEDHYILGFIVYSFDLSGHLVIHFINIQREARGMGVVKKLVKEVYPDLTQPIVLSQFHKPAASFLKKFPNLTYNPYTILADS